MSTLDRQNRADELVRIGREAIAKPDDEALDAFFAAGFVFHGPDGDATRDGLKGFFASMRAAFTDFAVERDQVLVVDDHWVASRTRMSGTFDNVFTAAPLGSAEPTGKPVSFQVMNIFRYDDDGRCAEEWALQDNLGLLRQLGVDITAA